MAYWQSTDRFYDRKNGPTLARKCLMKMFAISAQYTDLTDSGNVLGAAQTPKPRSASKNFRAATGYFRYWHICDMPDRSDDLRCWANNGNGSDSPTSSQFDPQRTFVADAV
jgi:hypothetical protein